MNPIIKEKVRILRPGEAKIILNKGIPKYKHQLLFKALLFTGMRYVELQRLKNNPTWFDGNSINLPSLKLKARQKERWIRLNPQGREIVRTYLNYPCSLPTKQTWGESLTRWAINAGLDPKGLCPKTTRKTYESWLTFHYGSRTEIPLSMGHTDLIAFKHYLGLPFTDEDKLALKEFVEGWI